jgi:predicted MPP superfamily phosphohydrolase
MLVLHISDIHFNDPICNTQMDPDHAFRNELVRDVRARTGARNPVGAIMVGGDIAFKGAKLEYEAALTWLRQLADAASCRMERVYVVPGNHDVDRGVVQKTASVRNAQGAIYNAADHLRYKELFAQFQDPDASRALLAPISSYNDFAAKFDCQIYTPEQLFWQQDLPLDSETVLRVYGLTSTILSGRNGADDVKPTLYLSPLQTVLPRADGVVNLVMCHHPPDWLMDGDQADDDICGRAAIHLFGHKHRQRITREANYVRLSAGAVNPDPAERGWLPGYNLIDIAVREENGHRTLHVDTTQLAWQAAPPMFVPVAPVQGETIFRHAIPIHGILAKNSTTSTSVTSSSQSESETHPASQEAEMTPDKSRNLILRFWELPASKRREIVQALNLIEETEMKLPEPERYGRAFVRAGQRGLIGKLTEAVAKEETP